MPHFEVSLRNKPLNWDFWPSILEGDSAEAVEAKLIKAGFDKRYWGFEIHAYSVNGEDF